VEKYTRKKEKIISTAAEVGWAGRTVPSERQSTFLCCVYSLIAVHTAWVKKLDQF